MFLLISCFRYFVLTIDFIDDMKAHTDLKCAHKNIVTFNIIICIITKHLHILFLNYQQLNDDLTLFPITNVLNFHLITKFLFT